MYVEGHLDLGSATEDLCVSRGGIEQWIKGGNRSVCGFEDRAAEIRVETDVVDIVAMSQGLDFARERGAKVSI